MPDSPDVLCLSVSSHLKGFDRPLIQLLSQQTNIAEWDYHQFFDQPSSLEMALESLHHTLKLRCSPIHLVGHGISGLLGLLYAQRYPEQVSSLTLLSVGIYATQDWQHRYYTHRQALGCDRQTILKHLVHDLFGLGSTDINQALIKILEQDLEDSLSPHSLFQQMNLLPIRSTVPLLVCGSIDDVIVNAHYLRSWQQYFWVEDECCDAYKGALCANRLWICSGGRHFFHYFYAQETAEQILDFWATLPNFKQQSVSETLVLSA